jgi:hypothetical protein
MDFIGSSLSLIDYCMAHWVARPAVYFLGGRGGGLVTGVWMGVGLVTGWVIGGDCLAIDFLLLFYFGLPGP